LASACSSDGADDVGPSATAAASAEPADAQALTTEEYIRQGEIICAEVNASFEAVAPPDDPSGLSNYLTELLSLAEAARQDFAALVPPADGEDVHVALLESLDTSNEIVEGAIIAAEAGDTVTVEDLMTQAGDASNAANEAADAYGFDACGSSDSTEAPSAA